MCFAPDNPSKRPEYQDLLRGSRFLHPRAHEARCREWMVRASGPCGQGTAKRLVWLEEEPNAGQDSGGLHPTGPLIGKERHSQGAV